LFLDNKQHPIIIHDRLYQTLNQVKSSISCLNHPGEIDTLLCPGFEFHLNS